MAENPRGRPVPYLRAWRGHRAWSQADLARQARVSISTITRAEGSAGALVSWESIQRLASALAIRPDQLWTERPPDGGG